MDDRIAQILAICIERLDSGQESIEEILARFPEDRKELEPLLRLATTLKNTPVVQPSDDFIKYGRARLAKALRLHNGTERVQQESVNIMKVRDRFGLFPKMVRAAGVGALLVAVSTFTVQASRQATPGSPLYPVKIGLENVQLALANEHKDMELQVQFAKNRNQEILRLQELNRYEDIHLAQEQFSEYIDRLSKELEESASNIDTEADADIVQEIDDALQNHVEVLQGVLEKVPDEAKPAIEKALDESTKELDNLNKHHNKKKPQSEPQGNDNQGPEGTEEEPASQSDQIDTQSVNPNSSPGSGNIKPPSSNEQPHADPTKDKSKKP